MSREFELALKLSAIADKKVSKIFKDARTDIGDLNKKIADLEQTRGNSKRFESLRKDILKTNREYGEAQKKVQALAKEMQNAENPSKKLQNEFEQSKRKASSLKDKFSEQKDELRKLKSSLDDAGLSSKNFGKDQRDLEKNLNDTINTQKDLYKKQEALKSARDRTENARSKLVDSIAPALALGVPIKKAMDAEETMADINKVADFDNKTELKEMQKKIMDMNTRGKIPMSFNDLGGIVASGAQAGLDKIELPKFASDSAKMGIAFDIDAETAGDLMASWRSAFQMDQTEVVSLADKINYLGDTTAAEAPKISDFVTSIGAMGEVGGVYSGELAAIGATLIGMGRGSEESATATSKVISTLNKGASASDRQQKAFKKLGYGSTQMAKMMQKDAQGTIVKVLESISKLENYEQSAVINDLFGETGQKAIGPLLQNIGALEENFKKVDESANKFANSMEDEFNVRVDTSANTLQILKNNMENTAIIMGEVLLPPISWIVEKFSGAMEIVQRFNEVFPNLSKFLILGAAAFIGLNIAMNIARYSSALMNENILTLKNSILGEMAAKVLATGATKGMALAQGILNAVMSANPIMLVVGLLAILIGYFLKTTGALDKLWEKFATTFPGAAEIVKSAAENIKNFFGSAMNYVLGLIDKVKGGFEKIKYVFTGKGSSSSGKSGGVKPFAKGGIVTSPTLGLVGEAGTAEAIIPLEKTANSLALWQQAGKALGADSGIALASKSNLPKPVGGRSGGSGDNYTFDFNVNITGTDDSDIKNDLKSAIINEILPLFLAKLEEIKNDKKRIAIT